MAFVVRLGCLPPRAAENILQDHHGVGPQVFALYCATTSVSFVIVSFFAGLAAHQHERAPVERKIFSISLAHGGAIFELRLAEGFVLVGPGEPLLVEERHQFLRLAIGD